MLCLPEHQRHRVQAIPLPGGWRTIREYMALVAVAAGTADLGSHHAKAGVLNVADMFRVKRLEETRPASAGIKLGIGAEQRQVTQPAVVYPGLLVVQQGTAERVLGAVVQQHP